MGKRAKKTSSIKKTILAGVTVIIIASLIGGYFLFFNKAKEPSLVLKKTGQTKEIGFHLNKPVRILVLGSDSRDHNIRGSRSDANMLVQLNPDKSANIVSFPRDSYVSIPGRGQRKINSALTMGGPELTIKTIENYSGLKIDYSMVAPFPRFAGIINAVGGVTFRFDKPLNDSLAGANFNAGTKHLRGGEALAVARSRHVAGGDFTRQARQQELAIAAFKQERPKRDDMSYVLKLVTILTKRINTNLSSKELFKLVRVVLNTNPAKIDHTVLQGGTGAGGGASVVHLDRSYANKVFAKMKSK
jgi:LCP family protein required for cell wall assembly